jgi:hypothetical protein
MALCCATACGSEFEEVGTLVGRHDASAAATTVDFEKGGEACAAIWLGSELGEVASVGATHALRAAVDADCASRPGDIRYAWEAPRAGCFAVTGEAGPGTSMLRVGSETCDGELLGCQEHAIHSGVVAVALVSGERVVVMLDVTGGEEDGSHRVTIEEHHLASCGP